MFRNKNDILKEKEEKVFTRSETIGIKSLISILVNEDIIVNNLKVTELGDAETFFNRHQKRINAMLDFFRGLFVIGYTDEEMLNRMKEFYRDDIENSIGLMEKLFGAMKKANEEDEDEQNEKVNLNGGFYPHGRNILTGLSCVVNKIFEELSFEEFKELGPIGINKYIMTSLNTLADKSALFKRDWEAAQKHPKYNNFFALKLTQLVSKLAKLTDEAVFYTLEEKSIKYSKYDRLLHYRKRR